MKRSSNDRKLRLSPLACLIASGLMSCAQNALAAEETVEFDNTFLMGAGARNINVARYSEGNPALPGHYDVSVYFNEQATSSLKLDFIETEKGKSAQACITPNTLLQLHIRVPDNLADNAILQKREQAAQSCLNLAVAIPQSSVAYNSNKSGCKKPMPTMSILPFGMKASMRRCSLIR